MFVVLGDDLPLELVVKLKLSALEGKFVIWISFGIHPLKIHECDIFSLVVIILHPFPALPTAVFLSYLKTQLYDLDYLMQEGKWRAGFYQRRWRNWTSAPTAKVYLFRGFSCFGLFYKHPLYCSAQFPALRLDFLYLAINICRISERRNRLLSQIEEVRRTRALQRASRKRHGGSFGHGLSTVAVVGYTNAVGHREILFYTIHLDWYFTKGPLLFCITWKLLNMIPTLSFMMCVWEIGGLLAFYSSSRWGWISW